MEFLQRGMEWCMELIGSTLQVVTQPIQLSEDRQSLELFFLREAIRSVRIPPFENPSSFSPSEFIHHHLQAFQMSLKEFDLDSLKERMIHVFSSLSLDTCLTLVVTLESFQFDVFVIIVCFYHPFPYPTLHYSYFLSWYVPTPRKLLLIQPAPSFITKKWLCHRFLIWIA